MKTALDLCSFTGLFIFLSGGIFERYSVLGEKVHFELSVCGLFFIPYLWLHVRANHQILDRSLFHRFVESVTPLFSTAKFFYLFIFLIVTSLGLASIRRYFAFHGDWDLAIYSNACANALYSSLRGETSLLADHFEPFLMLLYPLCSRLDPAVVLLAFQSLCLFVGAIGIRSLGLLYVTRASANLVAVMFTLFWPHQALMMLDYHSISLAYAFIPWLFYFTALGKVLPLFILSAAYMCVKENTSLTVIGFGLMLIATKKYKDGFLLSLFAAVSFALIMLMVYPAYRGGEESMYFSKYYSQFGDTSKEFLLALFLKPQTLFETLFQFKKGEYLLFLLLPFAFIPLLRPWYLLPLLPALLLNLLSNVEFMYSGEFHYEAEIFPILFCATLFCVKKSPVLKRIFLSFLIVFGLKSGFGYFNQRYNVSGWQIEIKNTLTHELKKIPLDARISTTAKILPHIAQRKHVFTLSRWQSSDYIIIGYPAYTRRWKSKFSRYERTLIPNILKDYKLTYVHPVFQDFRIFKKIKRKS